MKMHLVVALVAVVTLTTAPAFADPIVITGGSVVVPSPTGSNFPPFGFQLIGENTTIRGLTFDMNAGFVQIGQTVDLSKGINLTTLGASGPWDETVDGRLFHDVVLHGHVNFVAKPFRITSDSTGYQTPFTMSGTFSLFDRNGGHTSETPLLTVALTGQGIASTGYSGPPISDGSFRSSGVVYAFKPSPVAATPEPATLMLLAGGLAAITMRTNARRRRAESGDRLR